MKSITMDHKTNDTTLKLTVSAIMVALSTVLSFIKPFELPYGGSVTLFSFVPILFVGYAYGIKWGAGAGLVHGILQMIFGISAATSGAGFKWWQFLLCALLDYIIAFSALGTSGIFKKVIKNPQVSVAVGSLFACVIKYICHFLSGFILFGGWAEWYFKESAGASYGSAILSEYSGKVLSAVYSLIYNATFSVPETVISIVMIVIIISIKPIRKAAGIK